MADTEMSKPADWTPCSDEERQRIEAQTRMLTQGQFAYWSLYRYASTFEVAAMVLCTICAIGAGVVTPLMTVFRPALPQHVRNYSCAKQKQIVFGNLSSSFVGMESQSFESTEYQHLLRRYTLYFVYLGELQPILNPVNIE
jgi:ATP-binding cassette subfamily B (MDR/TAP) protein 1